MEICLVIIIMLFIIISVRERVKWQTRRDKNWDTLGEAKMSPLSQAITNMVGTAGGIYIALVLVQTFLELKIPAQLYFSGIALEPLAALAILLAIVQPFFTRFWVNKRF